MTFKRCEPGVFMWVHSVCISMCLHVPVMESMKSDELRIGYTIKWISGSVWKRKEVERETENRARGSRLLLHSRSVTVSYISRPPKQIETKLNKSANASHTHTGHKWIRHSEPNVQTSRFHRANILFVLVYPAVWNSDQIVLFMHIPQYKSPSNCIAESISLFFVSLSYQIDLCQKFVYPVLTLW